MRLSKVRNTSPARQVVPGWGEAGPGECLQVAPDVASHLVASGAWNPVEDRRQRRPAKHKREVTNDAA